MPVFDRPLARGAALTNGDSAFLRARLHPAVTDRYGGAACDAYVAGGNAPTDFTLRAIDRPTVYRWETDGISRDIPGTNTVAATRNGQDVDFHIALVDGTWLWFTDCGAPIPGAR